MNRRDFIESVMASIAVSQLPAVDGQALGEPLNLIWQDVEIETQIEWSLSERVMRIVAICYDPPILCSDVLTEKEIVEKGLALDEVVPYAQQMAGICRQGVLDELKLMAEQRKNSTFLAPAVAPSVEPSAQPAQDRAGSSSPESAGPSPAE